MILTDDSGLAAAVDRWCFELVLEGIAKELISTL